MPATDRRRRLRQRACTPAPPSCSSQAAARPGAGHDPRRRRARPCRPAACSPCCRSAPCRAPRSPWRPTAPGADEALDALAALLVPRPGRGRGRSMPDDVRRPRWRGARASARGAPAGRGRLPDGRPPPPSLPAAGAAGRRSWTPEPARRCAGADAPLRGRRPREPDRARGRRAAPDGSRGDAEILEAQAMMADDPSCARTAERAASATALDAAHALDAAFAEHREALAAAGGYLAERAADLDDLRDRAVAVASACRCRACRARAPVRAGRRRPRPGRHRRPRPADVLALVTEKGGPTSHTAILARGRGLPAVVACAGVLGRRRRARCVAVDGVTGRGRRRRHRRGGRARSGGRRPRERARLGREPAARAGPPTATRSSCCSTSAPAADLPAGATCDGARASGCSAPSSSSSTAARRRRSRSRSPPTRRCSGPRRAGTSWCAPSTPAPTSRCRSSACPTSPTRRSASAACGWPGSVPEVLDTQLDAIAAAARATGAPTCG